MPGKFYTAAKTFKACFQDIDSKKKYPESCQDFSHGTLFIFALGKSQHHPQPDSRQSKSFYIKIETNDCHQPAGHGRADIRAINYCDGLSEIHQARIDKAYNRNRYDA